MELTSKKKEKNEMEKNSHGNEKKNNIYFFVIYVIQVTKKY